MSRKGFTLAEILLTLTVIGVVAALTIPSLLQNTQQSEFKTALKRSYADLSQATLMIKNDNAGLKNVFTGSNVMKNIYGNYISYITSCNSCTYDGSVGCNCWHDNGKFYRLNGTSPTDWGGAGLIATNGYLVRLSDAKSDCSSAFGTLTRCGVIYVDVNGFKNPNTIGKDIFAFIITEDGLKPYGVDGSPAGYSVCTPASDGQGCTAVYLYQ